MTTQRILILFFGCLLSTTCLAQGASEVIGTTAGKLPKASNKPVKKEGEKKLVHNSLDDVIDVHFSTNENCSFKVNGKEQGEINMDSERTVRLKFGNYSLRFLSRLTGKMIDSSFKLTPALVKGGSYSYNVAFKKELVSAGKPVKPDSPGKSVMVPPPIKVTDGTSRPGDIVKSSMNDVRRTVELSAVNELVSNMVVIPAGTFVMGVAGSRIKELLPHTVTINDTKFGKYEITQQQWENVMGAANNKSFNKGCNSCPVENVSWNEVDSFILKINSISKNKFRLPTEAEWEYVAKKALAKEMETPGRKVDDVLEQTAWYRKNSADKTHPSGSKKPLLGIHDLLGNVAEWCQDYYTTDYQKDKPNNPSGPAAGREKVVKGGSFIDTDDLKPAIRNKETPSTRKNTIGFRLVLQSN